MYIGMFLMLFGVAFLIGAISAMLPLIVFIV